MTEEEHREETVRKKSKKRGFVRRHVKKIGVVIGTLLLLGTVVFCLLLYPKQGKPIAGTIDGEIDKEYYRLLLVDNEKIDDMSDIADILAEVYYLTHGEDIGQFRFTLFDEKTKPLRVRTAEMVGMLFGLFGEKYKYYGIAGINWGNGDIYLRKPRRGGLTGLLQISFHELGHGLSQSRIEQTALLVRWFRTKITGNLARMECPAELNEIDSIVTLMYLDPDLGYVIFSSSPYGRVNHDYIFSDFSGEYAIALDYSLYRCLEGGRVEEYSDLESLQERIKERTSGKTHNELIGQIHQGVLDMFRERFGDREDFEEKYSLLQQYLKYGMTDTSYEKDFFPEEEVLQAIEEKERFIRREHSAIISENLKRSLLRDYTNYDEPKAYALFNEMVADQGTKEWANDRFFYYRDFEWAMKYAYQKGDKEKAREIFDLIKTRNEREPNMWAARRINVYQAYFGVDNSTESTE